MYGRLIIKTLLLVISCALAGWLFLCAVCCIPVGRMEMHADNSAYLFEPEYHETGGYKELTGDRAGTPDYLTDAIMLLTAAYRSPRPAWQAALYAELEGVTGQYANESIITFSKDNPENLPVDVRDYARYWHGYLVILKPLFWLFGYGKIRYVLIYSHMGLFLLLQFKLFQVMRRLCLPLFFAWMFLNPPVIMLSLQYSWMSLCATASMLALLRIHAARGADSAVSMETWCLFFTLTGCLTTYLDLLTFPLITLGLPLVLWLSLYASRNIRTDLLRVAGLSVAWGAGYGLMWAMKWVLITLFTQKKILAEVWNQMAIRSGVTEFAYSSVITKNLSAPGWIYVLLLAVLTVLAVAAGIRLLSRRAHMTWLYLLIGCYPFVWYAVLQNHSFIHSHYTYRILSVTVFAILAALAEAYQFVTASRSVL